MVSEYEECDYDDEYDDTYDDAPLGQSEPDAKDDLTERRPFVLPRVLGGGHVAAGVEHEVQNNEDSENDEEKKGEFLRNPAELRAEAERRRVSQMCSRGRQPQQGGGGKRDVVGRPKGHGQDKSVMVNRARKNANKGKSYRAASDRKQAKGMF